MSASNVNWIVNWKAKVHTFSTQQFHGVIRARCDECIRVRWLAPTAAVCSVQQMLGSTQRTSWQVLPHIDWSTGT